MKFSIKTLLVNVIMDKFPFKKNIKLKVEVFRTILILIAIISFNCGNEVEENIIPIEGGLKRGGTYTINETENIRGLDPVGINDVVSHHVAHQIYDLLIDLDSNLQLVPQLATRWEISDDGKLYTFHLRKGAKFHDNSCFPDGKGREMNAIDVKYSFDRICDPRTTPLGYDYYKNRVVGAEEYFREITKAIREEREPVLNGVSGFIVKDDSTFQIKLKEPFGPFIYYMCLGFAYIVPREAVEMYGEDFFQNPVGTGPFVFEDWRPDLELNLTRNKNYWDKDEFGNQLPYLDKVQFRFMKEASQQLLEFKNGKLDECYQIPLESFKEVIDENKSLNPEYSKFILQRTPSLTIQYYGFLMTSEIFNNDKVRKAFNYAIDRSKIIKFVLNGQAAGGAFYGIVPPAMPDYDSEVIDGYEHDIVKAKELMKEAGYPDGTGFPEVTLQINEGGGRNIQIAEAIQSMLKAIGVTVKLQILTFAQHLDNIDAGRADFYRLGWIADYPDPENFLNLYYGKNVPDNPEDISPINSTRYKNEKYDLIFEEAIQTTDKIERYKLYQVAEQIAVSDAPMLYIFYSEDYRLLQPYVRGYVLDPMHRVNFRFLWLDK